MAGQGLDGSPPFGRCRHESRSEMTGGKNLEHPLPQDRSESAAPVNRAIRALDFGRRPAHQLHAQDSDRSRVDVRLETPGGSLIGN